MQGTFRTIASLFFAACQAAFAAQDAPRAPEQPIPFSHKAHAGALKLQCKMCHPNPDPGEVMRIAAAPVCMQCHSAIKTESPAIQRLAAAAKTGREIPWVRVYQIPSYVDFSHRAHLLDKGDFKGNTCDECHGPVAGRERLYRETNLSMGGCIDCHRARKASIDCTFCHDSR